MRLTMTAASHALSVALTLAVALPGSADARIDEVIRRAS